MLEPSPPARAVLIVCGLKREATIWAGSGAIALCGDAPTLRARFAALADAPTRLIVSFGLCGGLDPALLSGDVVVGAEVVAEGESLPADAALAEVLTRRLVASGVRAAVGRIAAAAQPVLTPEAKSGIRAATAADAVDMESLIAARFAAERGATLAILRAVADPADRALPRLALAATRADGGVNVRAVIGALFRVPAELPSVIAAGFDSRAAFSALRRCAGVCRGVLSPDL